jgi:hypothetical protein
MSTRSSDYTVVCLMCSTEVGHILGGRFVQHEGCPRVMPRARGLLRCCHCGGSLYLDMLDVQPAATVEAELARALAEDAA